MVSSETVRNPAPDRGARLLELGLAAFLIAAPLPFGAVGPKGRLGLELAAFALLALWLGRGLGRPTALPSRSLRWGLAGLCALALLQLLPLGSPVVSLLSPGATEIREASRLPPELLAAEADILGAQAAPLDPPATLSTDPGATASALRTGAALAALLLVSTTVAATCGARRLATALLVSAALQGLYGMLVLTSGHDRIWHLPKKHFLDCATGTFVNRNHFACLLAMSLACGMGLIYHQIRRSPRRQPGRNLFVFLLGTRNTRTLLLGLALVVGLAGLLLSYSRAGIALGLLALAVTILAAGRFQGIRLRALVAALVVSAAVVPLIEVGSDRLVERYSVAADEFATHRGTVWKDTLSLVSSFPVTGTGFGTFGVTYPLVRSPEVRKFYAHAHNDPLQALAEGGLIGAVFLILVALPVLSRLVRCIAGEKGTLAVGFAVGLAAMLLHGLVDFNFHIPANAATAAVLAGTIIGLPWKRES